MASPFFADRPPSLRTPMRLRYGVNESDSWWHFAFGPERERLWARLRALDVRIIRIFAFDKQAPDPVLDWPALRAYIQAVLNVGAIPLVTFAKFRRPFDDPRAIRWFAEQCAEIVWSCTEEWGGDAVTGWFWCVWNEPNNDWIGGGITFEQYRVVYEAVARGVRRALAPWLKGAPPRIGGPSVEGFTPFWLDWVWRLLHEVDPSLVGFINWHYYAEWRQPGEEGATAERGTMERLILAQAVEFGLRASQVARLIGTRPLLNICGEWNAHSHYVPAVREQFNQTLFGAVYGAAALIHHLRSGLDAEMVWTGTDDACGYGMLDPQAVPTPLYHAKHLCARFVRFDDRIWFPIMGAARRFWDVVVAERPDGRRSAFVVHLAAHPASVTVADLDPSFGPDSTVIHVDATTGGEPHTARRLGSARLDMPGVAVAVVTNAGEDLG
jgi:hypothetical protein